MPLQYKFVEVSPVTDETLEAAVNEWAARDWELEGIRFVTTEHSKRPSIAFVSFVRDGGGRAAERPREPRPLVAPDAPPRVITADGGDDVE